MPTLPTTATLERWLTGPRFNRLPARSAEAAAPALSFEFFPPKTEALETQLWACIRRLEPLRPRFVSVTYGAGGSTQARTHATVERIVRETSLVPAAHLTCVGAGPRRGGRRGAQLLGGRRATHRGPARRRPQHGNLQPTSRRLRIRLRPGGRPAPASPISRSPSPPTPKPTPPRRTLTPIWTISSASWMPVPPRAITQYFFDADVFLRFLDRCLAAGITAPIVPAIIAGQQFRPGTEIQRKLRRIGAGLDDQPVRRHRERSRNPPPWWPLSSPPNRCACCRPMGWTNFILLR